MKIFLFLKKTDYAEAAKNCRLSSVQFAAQLNEQSILPDLYNAWSHERISKKVMYITKTKY